MLADGTICHVSQYRMLMNVGAEKPDLKWMFFICHQGYASPTAGPEGVIYTSADFGRFTAVKHCSVGAVPWPKFRGILATLEGWEIVTPLPLYDPLHRYKRINIG
jgi:hypothetical protein